MHAYHRTVLSASARANLRELLPRLIEGGRLSAEKTMRSQIKAAGDYLLSVLKAEREVAYGRFYNAEPGTDVALVNGMWTWLCTSVDLARPLRCVT